MQSLSSIYGKLQAACTAAAGAVLALALPGCMEWDYPGAGEGVPEVAPQGLFVVNEGNFQYGNATLGFYDPEDNTMENEVFIRANGFKLGDVAQSMTIGPDGRGWVVVNNSHVVFAIDTDTFKEVGRLTGMTSPRFMYFVSPGKAYVTQLYDNRIFIVDPDTYSVTGHITVPGMEQGDGSTEQVVGDGSRYVYVNCYSYWNLLLKIDTETDSVADVLEVGVQPRAMALDCRGRLWVLTDGGYPGSPYAYEEPRLMVVDTADFEVEREFAFPLGTLATDLAMNGAADRVYWIADAVWEMPVDAVELPSEPLVPYASTRYFALTVDPVRGDVYVADAIDYQQPGIVYRYSPQGELIDSFRTGISPGAFCWKEACGD